MPAASRSSLRHAGILCTAIAAALLSALLIAPTASRADTVPVLTQKSKVAVGTQFHGTWAELSDDDRARNLDMIVDSGATWVRIDIGWSIIQPKQRGSYDLAWGVPFVEKVLNMAHDRGLKVLATFWLTPDWANADAGRRVLPTDVNDYATALQWAANRWATQVQAWEVWNEPNASAFLSPPDPVAYTRLLRAAYPAVHAGNPAAKVVFGGTMFVDTDWISQAYAAGAKGAYDVMAIHPYLGNSSYGPEAADLGHRERMTHTAALVTLMADKGESAKPIWFTEFGWSTHTNTSTTPVWEWGVSEAVQADYLKRTYAMVESRYPQVTNLFWYDSRDITTSTINTNNRGLIRLNFTAKPALAVMKCYARQVCPVA